MSGTGATSPGWETVVSSKTVKTSNKNKGNAANQAKKKFAERAPRLEDVLPMDQVNAIYNENGIARPQPAAAQPPQPAVPASPGKASPGKASKANAKKAKKKGDEAAAAPSKPKNLEAAIKQFRIKEFKDGLDHTRHFYASNPGMWVREAAHHLNECLASVESPLDYASPADIFSARPASALTKDLRKYLGSLLEECGDAGRQSGYEALVANLAYDLAKSNGSNVNGYLILLQMLAEHSPQLALSNIKRVAELIHSYQNQAGVCIPVLWALGQSGKHSLSTGIKVWLEFMRPLLRLKHYSRHVVSYMTGIWGQHPAQSAKSMEGRVLYAQQFFGIFDAMFTESSHLNKDLLKEFQSVFPVVKAASIGDCSVDHELFPSFLQRLSNLSVTHGTETESADNCKKLMTDCMAECLANNPMAVVSHWQQLYRSHFAASAYVLNQFGSKSYSKQLMQSKQILHNAEEIEGLVEAFQDYNSTCPSQKEGLPDAKRGCKNVLANLASMKSAGSGSGLPYKTLIILLAAGLGLVVNNDIEKKGSFKASSTGMFLSDIGMYERTVEAFQYSLDTYQSGRDLAETYLPLAVNQTRQNVGPALTKAAQRAQWAWSETKLMGNNAIEKANEYLPGAKDKVLVLGSQASRWAEDASQWLVVNGKALSDQTYKLAIGASQSVKVTTQDVIDGKIELKDVYNGAVDLGNKALLKFEELRQSYTASAK